MAAAPTSFIYVESIETAVPVRVAVPGRWLPISVSGRPLTAADLQRHFRAVLYFRGAGNALPEAAARARQLEQAMWVKESISLALIDHRRIAGRVCRRGGDGAWQVKLSDAGIRLVLASSDAPLSAFLERKEAALALWADVDLQEPEICAPFLMQLTRFQDGGYAVGVCCGALQADPFSLIGFLKQWARTHEQLRAQSRFAVSPLVRYTRYLHFQNPGAAKRLRSVPLDSASGDATATALFRAGADDAPADRRALAAACIAQAGQKLGAQKPPRFTVLAWDGAAGLNVHACTQGDEETAAASPGHALRAAYWNEAGLEEIALDGSKPVHVSYSVVSPCAVEGLIVVMPATGSELWISATIPSN